MERIKNWFKTNKDCFYPAIITLIIMLVAFIIKGVYPFGDRLTGRMDYIAGLVPSYTYLWDFIHGKESFLFNGELGLGANMYASSILNTFLSPISYLIGLSSRENVQYFIGFIVVIKLMCMATTSYIVFKKWFKNVDYKFLCLFSLLWTFSSWLFVHISNVGWLDVMIIFPFLIDAIKDIVEKAKLSRFIICLTLCLIYSYYMSYMILIGMIVLTISMSVTLLDKETRKRVVGQLFVGTLLSLLLSMVAFLPSFLQTQDSYRFNGASSDSLITPLYTKLSMMCFYGILLYLSFLLFKNHKDDKNSKFFMLFLGLTLLPILVEPINKMWHTGSYFSYPQRYSYITIFFLILASLYYLNNYYVKDQKELENRKKYQPIAWTFVLIMAIVYPLAILMDAYLNIHLAFNLKMMYTLFYIIPGLASLGAIIYFSKYLSINKRKLALGIITLSQILIYSIGYMGESGTGISEIYDIKEEFNTEKLDKEYAIKDETYKLTPNFPLIMEQRSISTWLHINSQYENINAQALGYDTVSTKIYSHGGTYFSDMLVNTKYVLSLKELDNSMYTLLNTETIELSGEEKIVYLYEYKYTLPLALIVDEKVTTKEFEMDSNPYENQNYLYKTLFNKNENIIDSVLDDKNINKKEYSVNIANKQLLYLYVNSDYEYKVYVNNELLDLENTNGIINLGIYENEIVKVKIESKEKVNYLEVATMDIEKVKLLSNENQNNTKIKYEGNKITLNVNAKEDGKLYIPLNYENSSWSAVVNDENKEVLRFAETYLLVDIEKGENEIVLTFTPKMMKIGALLSVGTLILVLGLALINIKFKFFSKKKFVNVMYVIGAVFGLVIGAYVYIIPLTK